MSNEQLNYWEQFYSQKDLKFPNYDGWLDDYLHLLSEVNTIIDLGCGNGINTIFLEKHKISPIACDFSKAALTQLAKLSPKTHLLYFDMTTGLPFLDDNIDVVIADLSLHYFSWDKTKYVISEVNRILKPGGMFFCRVNSLEAYEQSSNNIILDENYYLIDGCTKRFFTKEVLLQLFSEWDNVHITDMFTEKYRLPKPTLFVSAVKL